MVSSICRNVLLTVVLLVAVCSTVADARGVRSWLRKFLPRKAEPVVTEPPPLAAAVSKLYQREEERERLSTSRVRWYCGHLDPIPSKLRESFLGTSIHEIHDIAAGAIAEDRYTVADAFAVMDLPHFEERILSILLLHHRFERAQIVISKTRSEEDLSAAKFLRLNIVEELARRTPTQLDNWYLVDAWATRILGGFAVTDQGGRDLLRKLAESENEWQRRSAIVGTLPLLKQQFYKDFEAVSLMLMSDPSPHVIRGVRWMLQRLTVINQDYVGEYLKAHAPVMPPSLISSTLRHLDKPLRTQLLAHPIIKLSPPIFSLRKKLRRRLPAGDISL